MVRALGNLDDIYGFSVSSVGTVLYVVLGRLRDDGWAGLLGIGIMADYDDDDDR